MMSGFQLALFAPMALAVLAMGRQAPKSVNVIGGVILVAGLVSNAVYCGLYL